MSSLFTPIVVGACNTHGRLDPLSLSSTIPTHLASRSGVVPSQGRVLLPISVSSDYGPFLCFLQVDVQDNQAPLVLGHDRFSLFNAFVMSQGGLTDGPNARYVGHLACARAADNARGSRPDPPSRPFRDLVHQLVRLLFENHLLQEGYDASLINALLRPHGIFLDNCSTKHALWLLALHLINGMCACTHAEGCLAFHGTAPTCHESQTETSQHKTQ
jgi:hypothetical protein